MGLSGSGKSTLLRAVNGLAPVVRGSVTVMSNKGSVDPYRCSAKALRDLRMNTVSMVFQQFGLLRGVALQTMSALVWNSRASGRQNASAELLNSSSWSILAKWAGRKVGELSGGMQQRVVWRAPLPPARRSC